MPAEPVAIDLDAALAGRKVVALFHSTWCPYCRSFAPVFRRLAGVSAAYEPLEVLLEDEEDPLWERLGIEVVPAVIFFDSGRVAGRVDARLGVGIDETAFLQALERAP